MLFFLRLLSILFLFSSVFLFDDGICCLSIIGKTWISFFFFRFLSCLTLSNNSILLLLSPALIILFEFNVVISRNNKKGKIVNEYKKKLLNTKVPEILSTFTSYCHSIGLFITFFPLEKIHVWNTWLPKRLNSWWKWIEEWNLLDTLRDGHKVGKPCVDHAPFAFSLFYFVDGKITLIILMTS